MAVQTSTVPTAIANLKTLIAADATIVADNVQVTYSLPFNYEENEYVAVGYEVEHDLQAAAVAKGRYPREETYSILVGVSVICQGAGEMQTAVERAYALAARVEAVIYATDGSGITLNGAVRTAEITGMPLEQFVKPNAGALEARVTVRVYCTARRIST